MTGGKQNIEDFLRESSEQFEMPYTPDWPAFEQKLKRAIFFRRMKVASLVILGLVILNLSIFGRGEIAALLSGGQYYYQPRPEISLPHNYSVSEVDISEHNSSAAEVSQEENIAPLLAQDPAPISDENIVGASLTSRSSNNKPLPIKSNSTGFGSEMGVNENSVVTPGSNNAEPLIAEKSEEAAEIAFKNLPERGRIELDSKTHTGYTLPEPKISTALWEWRKKKQTVYEPYISPLQQQNPWSASINVYPNWTFRKFLVNPGKEQFLHRDYIDQIESAESGGVSLNVGLELTRRIGPITYLNSGVEYISYKTEANFDFNKFRTPMLNENGAIVGYQLATERERVILNDVNIYHYINIPLSISHEPWASDHIRLNLEAGFSYMYFASVEGRTLDYKSLEVIDLESRNYRKQMGSAFMKVGVLYHISQRFNFGFEPTLMYFTNTIYTEEYPFEVIPYSVGMNLKVQVKLN